MLSKLFFGVGYTLFFLCGAARALSSKTQAPLFVCSEKRSFCDVSRVDFFYQNVAIFPHDQHVESLDFSSNDAAHALIPFLYAQNNRFMRETLITPFFKFRERLDATLEKLLASTDKTEECTFRFVFKEKQKSVVARFVYQKEVRKNDTSGFTIRVDVFVFGTQLALSARTLNLLKSAVLENTVWDAWKKTCGLSLVGAALVGGVLRAFSGVNFFSRSIDETLVEPEHDDPEVPEDVVPQICASSARRVTTEDCGVQCGIQTEDKEIQCDDWEPCKGGNTVLLESSFMKSFLPLFVRGFFNLRRLGHSIFETESLRWVYLAGGCRGETYPWMNFFEIALICPYGFVVSLTSSSGLLAITKALQSFYDVVRPLDTGFARRMMFSCTSRICVIPLSVLRLDVLVEAIPLFNFFRFTIVFVDDMCKVGDAKKTLLSQIELQRFSRLASWMVVDRFKVVGRDGWDDRLFLIQEELSDRVGGDDVAAVARLAGEGMSFLHGCHPKSNYIYKTILGGSLGRDDDENQLILNTFFAQGEVSRVLRQRAIPRERLVSLKKIFEVNPSGRGDFFCFCSGSWQLAGIEKFFFTSRCWISCFGTLYVWYDDAESLEILRQKQLRFKIVLLYDGAGPLSGRDQEVLTRGLKSCTVLRFSP